MKNIFIILFLFIFTSISFASDIEIKLLKKSYVQLAIDLSECQKEAKRIDVPKSNLADHLALREKIAKLAIERERLKAFLDEIIARDKSSNKDKNGKTDNAGGQNDKTPGKPADSEKTKDPQGSTGGNNKTGKGEKIVKEQAPEKPAKVKEKLLIVFNKKIVKPGKAIIFTIIPPKHYIDPKIVWIKCSSNLSTLDSSPIEKKMRGYLVADPLITRAQNATVTALLKDSGRTGVYEMATAKAVINAYSQETKIELKVPSKMISGRSYNFLIQVPSEFKPPFSILVKSSLGKHLIVHTTTTSLGGSVKAWGNGDPKIILSGSISARVYDDSGKIGYVNKLVSIDEPTQADLDKIPMEEPPTWYEEAAKFTWKATKDTMKATGEVMKATGEAMKAVAEAEAKHGYLKNAMNKTTVRPPTKNYNPQHKYKPPPTPHWLKPKTPKPQKLSDPNAQNLGIITTRYPSVTIIAWDHGQEDGDKVKITLNASSARNISLKIAKQNLQIPLRLGHNEIKITALNEGSASPNTASFEVHDKSGKLTKKKWQLLTGKSAILITIYKP